MRPNLTIMRLYPYTTLGLIQAHCVNSTAPMRNKIPIVRIASKPPMVVLWMVVHLVGAKSHYVETKAQLLLVLDYLQPQVFNWCEGVVCEVRERFTACKTQVQR